MLIAVVAPDSFFLDSSVLVLRRVELHRSPMGSPRGVSLTWGNSVFYVGSIEANLRRGSFLHASLEQSIVDADCYCDVVCEFFRSVLLGEFVLDLILETLIECDHLRSVILV
jgi:hypothetical protein